MSKIEVNTVAPQCGTTLTLGESGDTVTLGTGASQSGFGRTGTVDWQTGDIKTSTFTAESGKGYFCNTAGGTFEVDLPAGTAGAIVSIQDYNNTFDSNSLTVDPNGSEKINGGTAGGFVTLSTEGEGITLVYIDSTVGWRSIQDNVFADPGAIPTYVAATGGTVTTVCTNFKVHTFTGPGTFCVSCAGNAFGSNTVSYMVIAGGGGGGKCRSGGGGAGGFREGRTTTCSYSVSPLNAPAGLPVSATGYPIVVGSGGNGSTNRVHHGGTGSAASFSTITSAGGGGGASDGSPTTGENGGSGGGGSNSGPGGTGNTPPVSPAQGTNGGNSVSGSGGGGGGGSTDPGSNMPSPSIAGQGGDGATTSINATPTVRAGGGGGGSGAGAGSPGGTGGGGNGVGNGNPTGSGSAGTVNTGSGGGGTAEPGGCGGAGGSGIVIIRYKFQ
jgi:hypothetical protein